MRSSNRPYLAAVDQLRAYAVSLVVVFHGTQVFGVRIAEARPFEFGRDWLYSNNPASTVVFEGHTGVTLFMVLSGFIFTVGTLGRDVSYPRFIANRLLRIYPLFLLLVLLAVAATPAAWTFGAFAQTVLGLGNLPGGLVLGDISSGALWAVAVEIQFYLLFPLLNRILSRFGIGTFLRLFAAIVLVRALVWVVSTNPDATGMLYYNLVGRIDQFLLGMIAAWLFTHHRQRFRGVWKLGVGLLAVVGMLWAFNRVHGFFDNGWWRLLWVDVEGGVWATVVVTYVATSRRENTVSRVVTRFGELSFSVYLLHLVAIGIMVNRGWWLVLPGVTPMFSALTTVLVLVLPVVTAISLVTYHGVERPFLMLRVKYLLPIQPAIPAALRGDADPRGATVRLPTADLVGARRPDG